MQFAHAPAKAFIIDWKTGKILSNRFNVADTREGITSGGSKTQAASAIAQRGCFVIQCSEDSCSTDGHPKGDFQVYVGRECFRVPVKQSHAEHISLVVSKAIRATSSTSIPSSSQDSGSIGASPLSHPRADVLVLLVASGMSSQQIMDRCDLGFDFQGLAIEYCIGKDIFDAMTQISSAHPRVVQVEGDDRGCITWASSLEDATALVRHFIKQPTVVVEGCFVNLPQLHRQVIFDTLLASKASYVA